MRTEIFRFREKEGYPPLIGYLPALYPNRDDYNKMLELCFKIGLRFVEVGIPTENPYLDGLVIRQVLTELRRETHGLQRFLQESGQIVHDTDLHGMAMLYNETLDLYGVDSILADCRTVGLEAVLVPDVTMENRGKLYKASLVTGIEVVNFIGIHHTEQEIEKIIRLTTGFLYLQSTEGSTGGQFIGDTRSKERLLNVKKKAEYYRLPVALGFGINTPDDAELAADLGADAVIVGTAFLKAAQAGLDIFSEYLEGFHLFLEGVECTR